MFECCGPTTLFELFLLFHHLLSVALGEKGWGIILINKINILSLEVRKLSSDILGNMSTKSHKSPATVMAIFVVHIVNSTIVYMFTQA